MVVVFGSINLDLVVRAARLPQPGETLRGESFATYPGGKGANQALAASRAGAATALVGAVGRDSFAALALAALSASGVDLTSLRTVGVETGVAVIHVTASGQNAISIVAGANAYADPDDVPAARLTPSTVLVLQQEVASDVNAKLAARAAASGARIILNAAPARSIDSGLLDALSVMVLNELEMLALAAEHGLPETPPSFVAAFSQRHHAAAIVTLGAEGVIAAERGRCYRLPAPVMSVVDTTGAGDAFVGALAAALDQGSTLRSALCSAVAAGSLACTKHGAQPSLPEAALLAPMAATLETQLRVITSA